jgi:peptide/nickel transport system substrate-binding protein/oligopeptide transport system substrate-binding protein
MAYRFCHSRRALVALIPGLVLALASCGADRRGALPVALAGDETAFQTAATRPSPAAQVLRAATVEGLVGFDAQGRVVPAIAERWIVTDDGLSYIFRLRDGTWPDGTPIDAPSVAAALRRARAALAGTALGLDLAPIDEIRVMTDRVVEVDLSAPLPDLLTLLAQPELGLPRTRLGSGPLGLRREGLVASLSPIPPEKRGMPAQDGFSRSVRPLHVEVESMAIAAKRFNDGLVDVALGGTIDSLPLAGTTMLSRGNVQLDPVMGLFGLQVLRAQGFLADPLRREALALAIDRDGLVGAFGIGGWSGTTRLVSPEVPDSDGSVGSAGAIARWISAAPWRASGCWRGWRPGRARPACAWLRPMAPAHAWPWPASGRISPASGCRSSAWTKASRPTCAWLIPWRAIRARPGSSINWPAR